MAEIIKLYQELSEVKDSLIQSLKENQDKLSVANDKLSVEKDNYIKSLKEINMLNQRISMLEKDAIKYKRLSSSKKIFLLDINLLL
jgi:flagellar motility protein MotE (MotC chaperone)